MQNDFVDLISDLEDSEVSRGCGRGEGARGPDEDRPREEVRKNVGQFVALIEGRTFLRECIRNSVQEKLPFPVRTYATVAELLQQNSDVYPQVVMLSMTQGGTDECINALQSLAETLPEVPVVVLSYDDDADLTRLAIHNGAKGYIPFTMGFNVVVGALRLIMAGGTYVPAHFLLQAGTSGITAPERFQPAGAPTSRELAGDSRHPEGVVEQDHRV